MLGADQNSVLQVICECKLSKNDHNNPHITNITTSYATGEISTFSSDHRSRTLNAERDL